MLKLIRDIDIVLNNSVTLERHLIVCITTSGLTIRLFMSNKISWH